jgi:endonuclease YncB( thermonuclease family)
MKKTALLLVLFSLIMMGWARAESFTGKVISITDGNTICVIHSDKARMVKMSGVDCPDPDQPYGPEAKEFLVSLISGREIWINVERMDHFNRGVSKITLDGQDVAVQVVQAGLGWYDTRYSSNAQIAEAQTLARASKSGLWSQEKPVPPWEFRQMSRGIIPNMAAGPTIISSGSGGYGFVPASNQPSIGGSGPSGPPGPRCKWGSYRGPDTSPCSPHIGPVWINM